MDTPPTMFLSLSFLFWALAPLQIPTSLYEGTFFYFHRYASVLYKQFLTPFRNGIWNHRQVSVGDRGVLPTRPINHRGYAFLAHTFGKMRSRATGKRANTEIRTVQLKNTIIQWNCFGSQVHPTQSVPAKCFRSYVHPTQSLQGKRFRSQVHHTQFFPLNNLW